MSESKAATVLGGPESGKTTYLGMLGDLLDREELDWLQIDGLASDTTGLQRLVDPLHDGNFPQRTKIERLSLEVRLATKGARFKQQAFDLRISDYDGEEVERLFSVRNRGWTLEWQKRAESNGLLLFIRPEVVTPLPELRRQPAPSESPAHHPLGPVPANPTAAFGPQSLAPEAPTPPPKKSTDGVKVPTYLALVELLQFIRKIRDLAPGERPARGSFRLGLIVTAWDELPEEARAAGPHRYLAEHAPLLEDFLWSNFDELDVFRFGLSSTGGNLRDPAYRDAFKKRRGPAGSVVWSDARGVQRTSTDISVPLCWALFGDTALQ